MRFMSHSIDMSKVQTVVYHLPDGQTLTVRVNGVEQLLDLGLELTDICDTSDIDGVVHVFPKGHA